MQIQTITNNGTSCESTRLVIVSSGIGRFSFTLMVVMLWWIHILCRLIMERENSTGYPHLYIDNMCQSCSHVTIFITSSTIKPMLTIIITVSITLIPCIQRLLFIGVQATCPDSQVYLYSSKSWRYWHLTWQKNSPTKLMISMIDYENVWELAPKAKNIYSPHQPSASTPGIGYRVKFPLKNFVFGL